MNSAMNGEREILERIQSALQAACAALAPFTPGRVTVEYGPGRHPVTEADRVLNRVLRHSLQRKDEGWLSEESFDDRSRLRCERVWVVDPLDGTAEFVAGIPEWSVSIAFVCAGRAIAGGVCNPATCEMFLGTKAIGVTCNGVAARSSQRRTLDGALVLASRSEFQRGRWRRFQNREFAVRPVGSIAYKLALVAVGKADATWTLVPKHEWDVAAGVALVEAAGGFVTIADGALPTFNNPDPRIRGLIAGAVALRQPLQETLAVPRATVSGLGA